jgi:serine/threonine protein kinase
MGCGASAGKYSIAESSSDSNAQPEAPAWIALPAITSAPRANPSASLHMKMLQYPSAVSLEDFECSSVLGRGKFGEVVLAQHKEDSLFYALKKISKVQMVERKVSTDGRCLLGSRRPGGRASNRRQQPALDANSRRSDASGAGGESGRARQQPTPTTDAQTRAKRTGGVGKRANDRYQQPTLWRERSGRSSAPQPPSLALVLLAELAVERTTTSFSCTRFARGVGGRAHHNLLLLLAERAVEGTTTSFSCAPFPYLHSPNPLRVQNKDSVTSEITNLMRIRHPFVAHLFGFFQDDRHVTLVLEYCCGGELFNRLKHRTRFSPDEAKFYITEIALALDFLQSPPLSMVYRDLKPENVMLSSAGHVRLVDFGFAVPLNADGDSITGGCGTAM